MRVLTKRLRRHIFSCRHAFFFSFLSNCDTLVLFNVDFCLSCCLPPNSRGRSLRDILTVYIPRREWRVHLSRLGVKSRGYSRSNRNSLNGLTSLFTVSLRATSGLENRVNSSEYFTSPVLNRVSSPTRGNSLASLSVSQCCSSSRPRTLKNG